jgi:hypothetical protein
MRPQKPGKVIDHDVYNIAVRSPSGEHLRRILLAKVTPLGRTIMFTLLKRLAEVSKNERCWYFYEFEADSPAWMVSYQMTYRYDSTWDFGLEWISYRMRAVVCTLETSEVVDVVLGACRWSRFGRTSTPRLERICPISLSIIDID